MGTRPQLEEYVKDGVLPEKDVEETLLWSLETYKILINKLFSIDVEAAKKRGKTLAS